MERVIQHTADGSATIAIPSMAVTYHSTHGAIQESMHVFIAAGWQFLLQQQPAKQTIHLLEMGFGTGLNALLTYQLANEKEVYYETLEQFPLPETITQQLGYADNLSDKTLGTTFSAMHACEWGRVVNIGRQFHLCKRREKLEDYQPSSLIDLVYFDAFAPNTQPELWTSPIFNKLYQAQSAGGILVTSCSKGDVRRAMLAAGYQVEKIPGPPGKREMLRAIKK